MKIIDNNMKTTGWVTFSHGELQGCAKMYSLPSEFGIRKGRVSKLWLADKHSNCLFNYDRSPDINAIGIKKRNEIVKLLEAKIK